MGCRRSSVDLSAPSILLPRIRVPSTSFYTFVNLNLNCVMRKDANKKRPILAHFYKKKSFSVCDQKCGKMKIIQKVWNLVRLSAVGEIFFWKKSHFCCVLRYTFTDETERVCVRERKKECENKWKQHLTRTKLSLCTFRSKRRQLSAKNHMWSPIVFIKLTVQVLFDWILMGQPQPPFIYFHSFQITF